MNLWDYPDVPGTTVQVWDTEDTSCCVPYWIIFSTQYLPQLERVKILPWKEPMRVEL